MQAPQPSRESIEAMVTRHELPLVRYATRIVGDSERAKEVVQDTFVRLLEAQRQDDDQVAGWLYRVCRNRAIDVRRHETPMVTSGNPPELVSDPLAEAHTAVAEVLAALEGLPPNERDVLERRYRRGESYQEISAGTGLSVGNVGFLLHRGMRQLRVRLGVVVVTTVLLVVGAVRTFQQPEKQRLRHQLSAIPGAHPRPPTMLDRRRHLDPPHAGARTDRNDAHRELPNKAPVNKGPVNKGPVNKGPVNKARPPVVKTPPPPSHRADAWEFPTGI